MLKNLHRLKKYLSTLNLSEQEYQEIEPAINKENTENLIVYSEIGSICLIIMFFVSFITKEITADKMVYLICAVIMFIIFLVSKFKIKDNFKLLIMCVHFFVTTLFVFGVILGTVTNPSGESVTFVALILTIPMLFTDKPTYSIAHIILFVAIFIIVASQIKERNVFYVDIINVSVFSILSMINSTYINRIKYNQHLLEYKNNFLGKTDLLTELHNRNYYEQMLEVYPTMCDKSIICIYLDVNGLHELNNSKGHDAGDIMLKFVAKELKTQFYQENTYRIGGDEFVAFSIDETIENVHQKLDMIVTNVENNSYHVSIGYELQNVPNIDMCTLIKQAEENMYINKRQYYQELGADRMIRK